MEERSPRAQPIPGGAEQSSDSCIDLDISYDYSDQSDLSEEEKISVARFRQSHRSRTTSKSTPASLSDRIAQDRQARIAQKEKKKAESDAPRYTIFIHNIATITTTLADRIGPPVVKAKTSKKAVGLSYDPTSDSDEAASQLPVSPFFTMIPAELSECLAGADTEGDENRDKAYGLGKLLPTLRARMGWYN